MTYVEDYGTPPAELAESALYDSMFNHGAALFSAFMQSSEEYEGDNMDALDLPRGSLDEYETQVDDYDYGYGD